MKKTLFDNGFFYDRYKKIQLSVTWEEILLRNKILFVIMHPIEFIKELWRLYK